MLNVVPASRWISCSSAAMLTGQLLAQSPQLARRRPGCRGTRPGPARAPAAAPGRCTAASGPPAPAPARCSPASASAAAASAPSRAAASSAGSRPGARAVRPVPSQAPRGASGGRPAAPGQHVQVVAGARGIQQVGRQHGVVRDPCQAVTAQGQHDLQELAVVDRLGDGGVGAAAGPARPAPRRTRRAGGLAQQAMAQRDVARGRRRAARTPGPRTPPGWRPRPRSAAPARTDRPRASASVSSCSPAPSRTTSAGTSATSAEGAAGAGASADVAPASGRRPVAAAARRLAHHRIGQPLLDDQPGELQLAEQRRQLGPVEVQPAQLLRARWAGGRRSAARPAGARPGSTRARPPAPRPSSPSPRAACSSSPPASRSG